MAKLAQVQLVAAPACPNCRQPVTDLPLDDLVKGAEHQCLFCGHFMRVPEPILKRLVEQRDAARAAAAAERGSFFSRLLSSLSKLFGKKA